MNSWRSFFDTRTGTVSVIYFLAGFFILYHYGIQLGGEAEKYIDNAHRILNGHELRNGVFGIFYFVYSLLVAVFIGLKLNLAGVVIVQLLLSWLAAIALYRITWYAFENRNIAFIAFIAYLFCYPIQKWNFYLFSESLHTSMLVFGIYFSQRFLHDARTRNGLLFGAVMLLILFSRPVGVIFLLSSMLAKMVWAFSASRKRIALLLAMGVFGIFIGAFYSPLGSFINPDSIKRMEVICQVPEANAGIPYTEFNRGGISETYRVIRDEVGWGPFLNNGFRKLGFFYGMYRPYFSLTGNTLLLLHLVIYPFALIGLFWRSSKTFRNIKWLSVFYLLITSLAIFFTCDDWANRFISPAFPFILILATGGLMQVLKGIRVRTNRS